MSKDLTDTELQQYWQQFFTLCQTCLKPNGRYWCDKCEKTVCEKCGQGDKFISCPIHD